MIRCELKENSKYIGVGVCVVVGVGLALENIGAGITLGFALSSALIFPLNRCYEKSSSK